MIFSVSTFSVALQRFFHAPDELIREAGASGELLAAKIRVLVALALLLIPLLWVWWEYSLSALAFGLGGVVIANGMAQLLLALARGGQRHRWLPWLSSSWDIGLISLLLVTASLHGRSVAELAVALWPLYVLAIAGTALRTDARLSLYAGGFAIVNYLLLSAWGDAAPITPLGWQPWLVPLAVMLAVTLLTCTLAVRMQRLVELSGRDGLTGLPNRSWLLQWLPRELDLLQRRGGSLSLILLDLDHFKRVHDEFGHRAGDRAIRRVSAHLNEVLREDEYLVRMAGGEFVLMLRDPIGSAWERIERTRRDVAQRLYVGEATLDPESGGTYGVYMSFSAGVACWPQDGRDTAALLDAAKRRLNAAKQDGCNRVYLRDSTLDDAP